MDQIKIKCIGIFWHFKSMLILTVVQCRQADIRRVMYKKYYRCHQEISKMLNMSKSVPSIAHFLFAGEQIKLQLSNS